MLKEKTFFSKQTNDCWANRFSQKFSSLMMGTVVLEIYRYTNLMQVQ